MDPAKFQMILQFFKTLSDENRLRMIGLLSNSEQNVGDLAAALNLKEPTVSHHLSKLRELGLVNLRAKGNQRFYRLNDELLKRFSRMTLDLEKISFEIETRDSTDSWIDELDMKDWEKKVLRDYTHDGKLKQIPVKLKKLLVVLRMLATLFERDRMYTEKEVNAILTAYHEDYARLRRELVEFGFLRRERGGGNYWVTPEDEKPREYFAGYDL